MQFDLVGRVDVLNGFEAPFDIINKSGTKKIPTHQISNKYTNFIDTVQDTQFWEECGCLQKLLYMPSELIGEAESDGSSLSQVYTYFQKL